MIRGLLHFCLGAAIAWGGTVACAAEPIESTYADHARGVQLAREGRYDEGLALLRPLVARFPDNYPLLRDLILINTWKGDCAEALRYFPRIAARPHLEEYLLAPLADCAVRRARAGEPQLAIEVLAALVPHTSDKFALRRDLTLVTIWAGDCRTALARFEPIRNDERAPPYLIAPVSNCLLREGRRIEALTVTEAALARTPDDPELQLARTRARVALAVDGSIGDDRPAVQFGLSFNESDRGAAEWQARTEVSAAIAEQWRGYARYLVSRSSDAAFDPGRLNRAGVGLRWYPSVRVLFEQEFSTDVRNSGKNGSHTRLEIKPNDTWRVAFDHDTFAEDISVRARANDIEADRSQASATYNSIDYVWSWRGSTNRYDFSDGNRRADFFTALGYAYALQPAREQRIFLEWSQSHNTLSGTPYFNPVRDRSIVVSHRTDFVFDSRFKRHVDHLSVWLGSYRQEEFGTRGRWGAKVEQDYDFDSGSALSVGLAFYRNVYDGQPENEWRVELLYRRRF